MNPKINEYQNELYLSASAAAFFRDSISSQFQLHWHFAGKCEGLLNGKVLTLEEAYEKFFEASAAVEQLLAEDAWQEWSQAYGHIDGFAEVIAAQSALVDAAEPTASEVKLLGEASSPGASEYRRELVKTHIRACRYRATCGDGRTLHCYFEGKATALRRARAARLNVLAEEFETARYRAHREAPDWKEREYQQGLSAGFAEATALAMLTKASRSAARA